MYKNARKIIMGATLALIMGVSVVGVNAETQKEEGPFYQETDINITVQEGTIEEPGDGGDGGDGGSNKGKLAIWLKPSPMEFEGKFREEGYTLPLKSGEAEGTKNEFEHRRLAIADVRANEVGWSLKAKLTDLTASEVGKGTITEGYSLSMQPTLGKYQVKDDGTVDKDTILKESNGVEAILSDDNIVIDKSDKVILKAEKTDDNQRPGKGYTAAKLNDLKMHFEPGKGLAGDFFGKVEWTLTDSPQ